MGQILALHASPIASKSTFLVSAFSLHLTSFLLGSTHFLLLIFFGILFKVLSLMNIMRIFLVSGCIEARADMTIAADQMINIENGNHIKQN